MEVVNLPGGRPTMRLTGGALERLAAITPPGYEAIVHVSLTDDPPLAQAFVSSRRAPTDPSVTSRVAGARPVGLDRARPPGAPGREICGWNGCA